MKLETFKSLITRYQRDEKTLLRENPSLENLYAFSNQREGVIEWYPFEEGSKVLLIGAGEGALADIWLRKNCNLTVYEPDKFEAEKLLCKFEDKIEKIKVIYHFNDINEKYDYVVSVGTLHTLSDVQINALFDVINDSGKLIVACNNRYGIKWWAGGISTGSMYSREELTEKLRVASSIKWYYPMQDYMLPTCIYSDKFLPSAGELAHVIPAYNDNEFSTMDLGKKYDEICRDGRFTEFANSFVVVASKNADNAESEVIYCKYNRTRKDEYKTKTIIFESSDGVRSVEKSALYEAGKNHIRSLAKKYEILNNEGRNIEYAKPELINDGWTVKYDYIEGETLADKIAESIANGADVYEEINNALRLVIGNDAVHNIDSIFSNYLFGGRVLGGKVRLTGIDYEWVSDKEQDKKFITYRILCEFYDSNFAILDGKSRESFLKKFGITPDDAARFWQMEHDFQEEITGDTQAIYLDNYRISVKTAEELLRESRNLSASIEGREGLLAQLHDQEAEIKGMTEVKRLTDNHVANLEQTIANLRAEVDEKAKALEYLNAHEAAWSKAKRAVGNAVREKYPEGSEARKKLEYKKLSILHPGEYRKLMHTEEGKNLVEGDFKIGSIYREYGKLDFEGGGFPLVSIIIPCYNQIEYTYRCLVSIKEYTRDINYEVIIADDQSTDATCELDKFVSGVTVCRTPENFGFLKNCNNAARQARGKFIMFLNNDTTVTEGWLSSLVDLMNRDESVGMTGSKLVFPDGRLQEAGGIIWSDGSGWNYGRGDDPDDHQYNYVREVDYISGAAILIRSELWKEIGGFDERFAPAYCEDSDFAFEVRKAGYKVVYQPLSKVIHYEGISNGTDVNGTGLKKYQVENSKKLKEKWADEFAKQYANTGNPDPFRARERSRGKKIILFVDHYVPTWDKDAGSKTTFMYLKMLLAKGYEVKFLGANYHHDEPYSTVLQQMGIEILYGGRMEVDIWTWIDKHAKDIQLVYLNRPHIAAKYIDYIREHTALNIVFYGHDLHFLRLRREFELTGDMETREKSQYWKSVEFGIMHKTDMNYYPSQIEIDAINDIDPTVKAKAITAYVYDEFHTPVESDFAKREGILFVGGFAHPPNKDGLLWFAEKIWPRIRMSIPDAKLYVVGSNADEDVLALDSIDNGICIKGFVSEEELRELYDMTRMVIVPLRYGAGVKGKTVEALYYGSPIVTTSVGAEGIPNAETVMKIADDEYDFADAVTNLYKDVDALSSMSLKALEYIKQNNSIDAAWEIIKEDFE